MGSREVRAVVFDMDGTLLDSLPVVLECYRRAILEFGGPDVSPGGILAAFSIGPAAAMLETLIGVPVGQQAVASYETHLEHESAGVSAYPGVGEALVLLSARIPLGVFTAADSAAAEILLRAAGLRGPFGPVLGANDVARPKPAPDGLVAVCEILGVPPSEVAYVGDGPADTEVARSCGALAVAAGWGHQYRDDRDADVTLRSPEELVGLVGFRSSREGGAG